jgi:hypothetical protein
LSKPAAATNKANAGEKKMTLNSNSFQEKTIEKEKEKEKEVEVEPRDNDTVEDDGFAPFAVSKSDLETIRMEESKQNGGDNWKFRGITALKPMLAGMKKFNKMRDVRKQHQQQANVKIVNRAFQVEQEARARMMTMGSADGKNGGAKRSEVSNAKKKAPNVGDRTKR